MLDRILTLENPMNATWMGPVCEVIATSMARLDHHRHRLSQVPAAAVRTGAVVAAKAVPKPHERARAVLHARPARARPLSPARFNRRLPALAAWLPCRAATVGEVRTTGAVCVIDRRPRPVCRRVRARGCHQGRGRIAWGYCAANAAQCFGWRLHRIGTPEGLPVRVALLPAALAALTPLHAVRVRVRAGSRRWGDTGSNRAKDAARSWAEAQLRLRPVRRTHMQPHGWVVDALAVRAGRQTSEPVHAPAAAMGIARLPTRTKAGGELKVHAALMALQCWNAN